jgi:hypothetical protein
LQKSTFCTSAHLSVPPARSICPKSSAHLCHLRGASAHIVHVRTMAKRVVEVSTTRAFVQLALGAHAACPYAKWKYESKRNETQCDELFLRVRYSNSNLVIIWRRQPCRNSRPPCHGGVCDCIFAAFGFQALRWLVHLIKYSARSWGVLEDNDLIMCIRELCSLPQPQQQPQPQPQQQPQQQPQHQSQQSTHYVLDADHAASVAYSLQGVLDCKWFLPGLVRGGPRATRSPTIRFKHHRHGRTMAKMLFAPRLDGYWLHKVYITTREQAHALIVTLYEASCDHFDSIDAFKDRYREMLLMYTAVVRVEYGPGHCSRLSG